MKKFFSIALLFVAILSCKKVITVVDGPIPDNPYDTVNYDETGIPEIPIDSNTFLGIHKYILSVKCAQPACHDGTFEPDYRTVESAYHTLVYAPVVKNNADSTFEYRVVPYDATMSWLHERITTEDAVLGKMPLYDSIPPRQIQIITDWINNGAKDIFGNVTNQPNAQPSIFGIYARLPNSGNQRVDTIRGTYVYNPFYAPANEDVEIWWGLYDDVTLPPLFTYDKIKFSTDPNNFDAATELPLTVDITPTYFPAFNWGPAPYFLHYTVNTSQWNVGDIVYMRVYVKDSNHTAATEIPSGTSPFYLQTFCAFKIQ
ncbi:MAG TPA: hypothetical protein DCQ93_03115 [Bacteroidetes bacterium]|nr:hypothetical protein [Bacteroidota bacterium]